MSKPEANVALDLLQRAFDSQANELRRLKQTGGGGTSGPMDPSVPLRDYVDKADEAVESRLQQQLAGVAKTTDIRSNVWGATAALSGLIVALAGLIIGLLAFGGDRFDGGMSASSIADNIQTAQRQTDVQQDRRLQQIDDKLDVLIERSADPGAAAAD